MLSTQSRKRLFKLISCRAENLYWGVSIAGMYGGARQKSLHA
jgi:hypothetical protein